MNILHNHILKLIFHHFYHTFAFSYDWVASIVSNRQWFDWVLSIEEFNPLPPILELGFGTGHLLSQILQKKTDIIGIDESWQMALLTSRKIKKNRIFLPYDSPPLIRARAENVPFISNHFGCVLSTFPTKYIFGTATQQEIYRVLKPGGRQIILLSSWITGKCISDKLLALVYKITGQSPSGETDLVPFLQPMICAGFDASFHWKQNNASKLLFIICQKPCG